VQGVEIQRALVYVCSKCGNVAATPQVTAGRVFAALETGRSSATPTEIRVPEEAEDLAYAIFAALGLRPSGDVFALPIALGLRHALTVADVDEKWRVLDDLDKTLRARPILSSEIVTRLEGLQREWRAPDRSTLIRWLVVAGAESVGLW
jgi:hypothetical protein